MRRRFSSTPKVRFLLVDGQDAGDEPRGRVKKRVAFGAGMLLAGGSMGCIVAGAPFIGAVLIALVALLATVVLVERRRPLRPSGVYLEADAGGLRRVTPEGASSLVRWADPFGVALLASYGRPHALLAFTTADETRYVPARIDGRSDDDDALFAQIAVLADLDLVDGIAHDAALPAATAGDLLRFVEARHRQALGRVYLSDGRGDPIALDRGTLSVKGLRFDLTSRLEWRTLMFHESTGQSAALYQATWMKQGPAEVVLVAQMPASIVARDARANRDTGHLGRALKRDLKLLQAPAEAPPARDSRVAIDRPFMLAIRRALAEAPLAMRTAIDPPPRPRTERRGSVA